jgi:hypothetical protein
MMQPKTLIAAILATGLLSFVACWLFDYPAIFSRLSRHMLKLSAAAKLTQTR